jgi:type I restriction enzyme M protein
LTATGASIENDLPDDEDDFDFADRVRALTAKRETQMAESVVLDERIRRNLAKAEIPE